MDTLETSRPNAANTNMSCCGSSMQASDPSVRTAATGMPGGALDRLRPLLGDRRVLIIAAIALAVIGVWAGWGWVVALGIAPLILAVAPCLIMCALGLCMMGKGMSGQGSGGSAAGQGRGPGTAMDPVSLRVLSDGAVASAVYQGRAYYFESRENRDAFESDPTKYLSETPVVGQATSSESASTVRS